MPGLSIDFRLCDWYASCAVKSSIEGTRKWVLKDGTRIHLPNCDSIRGQGKLILTGNNTNVEKLANEIERRFEIKLERMAA